MEIWLFSRFDEVHMRTSVEKSSKEGPIYRKLMKRPSSLSLSFSAFLTHSIHGKERNNLW